MRIAIGAAVTWLAFTGLVAASDVEAAVKRHTEIAAQQLGPALRSLAKEHGFQIVFASKDVSELRTQGAVGELTTGEALAQILAGTGLTYRYLDDSTVTVEPSSVAGKDEVAIRSSEKGNGQNAREAGFSNPLRLADATAEAQAAEGEKAAGAEEPKLQEIVVTAQKREQRLQDVPISISVVTADDIDRRGMVSAEDYLRGIPGVSTMGRGSQGGNSAIVIRGLETSLGGQNFGSGSTVATYFGETPTTSAAGISGTSNIDLKLVDIERVEVLRGPQGTAFGNASLGGAVRTIPAAPKLDRIEGKVAGGYSFTSNTGGDNYNVEAVANIPLVSDRLALRAVGYKYDDSGFYRNVAGSDPTVQQTLVTPFGAVATNEEEVGAIGFLGGRVSALFQATDALALSLSYLKQQTESDGQTFANLAGYEHAFIHVAPTNEVRGQAGGVHDTEIDIANATLEYGFDWADFVATYSYVTSGSESSFPYHAYIPVAAIGALSHYAKSEQDGHFGEVRLTTKFDGAWNFLVGLYAEDIDNTDNLDDRWGGTAQTNIFNPGQDTVFFIDQARKDKQKAAFAEVSWEFAPGLTLTGGARYYDYERTRAQTITLAWLGVLPTDIIDDSASGASFRGGLNYKPNDDTLLYATWSQGFRLGIPVGGVNPGLCDQNGDGIIDGSNITVESTGRVESDNVDNYEIGGKFTLLDSRLAISADVYRMDWTEVPVSTRIGGNGPCAATPYTANAGVARSEGVEFQANFYVTKAFRVDVGGSYVSAKLREDVELLGAVAGDRLPGGPEVNASLGLQYEFTMGGYPTFVRADPLYVGSYFGNVQESFEAGGYVQVDASARVEFKQFNVDLFVRNLTDEDEFVFRGIGDSGDLGQFYGARLRPRTVGVQFTFNFAP